MAQAAVGIGRGARLGPERVDERVVFAREQRVIEGDPDAPVVGKRRRALAGPLRQDRVAGVEVDGRVAPIRWFSLEGSVTWQNPEYANLQNTSGADPSAVNGKQIIREAKIFGNLRPSFDFDLGEQKLSIFGRFEWVGRRYVDLFNRTAMPGYQATG
ncbi:MAG TPA: hypothetical protein VNU48_00305, partial [Burkholderiaceae bacterium]|nr:hypothetical protein [Burkholderiaceae bacterium]